MPLISNQMGPAPSRFRNENQEQEMRTVANGNGNEKGSTNDPDPKFIGSTETQAGSNTDKVSTNKRETGLLTLKTPLQLF